MVAGSGMLRMMQIDEPAGLGPPRNELDPTSGNSMNCALGVLPSYRNVAHLRMTLICALYP